MPAADFQTIFCRETGETISNEVVITTDFARL